MMPASLTFRRCTRDDAAAVWRACFPQSAFEKIQQMLARAEAAWQAERGIGVVACLSGSIVGFGQLTFWARVAEISDLSVTEAQRGRGIGTALLEHLIALGAERRALIEIGVAHSNKRALALYRRLGFRFERTLLLNVGQGLEPIHYLTLSVSDWAER
ncbi:MAG: hypothetical protein CUN49_09050 [Candidatus Thermofonsia Clade 1 bacterium]|uniref:N-acetyltransferase domain-containing protein n=1 Tax=Candidatus Thermofonsia Clade 1 bacterium TaxID=2364210 RepID=A0A2M8PDW4_9CHLR|nr:MAG: hypothetical protein CUN49_09050 [Candidatus Thermofonsia Clade 1 bacterium]RMF49876.1 MAG: GNAT family N-acetyltransferase [Chloroflexota bacterium]